jgi:hypothetical protein
MIFFEIFDSILLKGELMKEVKNINDFYNGVVTDNN